jgi:murein DD-endopeptidase MepM/ murein hydrolase activator NlpD
MGLDKKCSRGVRVITLTIAVLLGQAFPAAAAAPARWVWPVAPPQQILRPFEAPPNQYSAGHRGIDIGAAAGDLVYAPADGIVAFTGVVADRPLLSVLHSGDLRSSLEPVLALVAEGEQVVAGQVIGAVSVRTGPRPEHCLQSCLHFGVRLHGQYVSPLLLLGSFPRAVLLPIAAGRAPYARGWALR